MPEVVDGVVQFVGSVDPPAVAKREGLEVCLAEKRIVDWRPWAAEGSGPAGVAAAGETFVAVLTVGFVVAVIVDLYSEGLESVARAVTIKTGPEDCH